MPPPGAFVEIFGDQAVSPLPVGLRSGDLVRGFRIVGTDPDTGALGDGVDAHLRYGGGALQVMLEVIASLDDQPPTSPQTKGGRHG